MGRERSCAWACVVFALLLAGCAGARVKTPSREALACSLDATRIPEANACTDAWMSTALRGRSHWTQGDSRINGSRVVVEFRGLSPYFASEVVITRADDVPVWIPGGVRHRQPGFGVPLAVISDRCDDAPVCELLPYSGVFRPATAWLEADAGADARLVIGNPLRLPTHRVGATEVALAEDTTAAYAVGMRESPIGRLAIWGLLGGDEVAHRAGVYLMEDYDPAKRPLVMLHGLGSSPLVWARLSNDVWGDRSLRNAFQIWHVVYSTDTPLLVTRRRIARYLDRAFEILDPERDDPAREGIVIVGHSLGGVIARLLSADSGDTLWTASFTAAPSALQGDADDVRMARELLVFAPYPGIRRAIFLAAPHRGSPLADRWYSRIAHRLAGHRADEMQSLRRIARAHPDAIQPALRQGFQTASINSISTLQEAQPVRRANESLLPAPGIAYHTIAGRRAGARPEGDGVVPLASALLPDAASTSIVDAGHDLYSSPEVVAEVLRILRADIASARIARRTHDEPQ
ncbi:alpha/beta hydrolase [Lysobacter sp. A6]|uniref:Alpha/beta hydrolase n=1 Tax=Noviluteimonas lactosilytica TaxID=2888523 RepID=A0ABS8JGP5_9GAMM|nr:alpha/beta hydrolase [Lysobacter lactosilyticus]MCC8362670.1 alpha/beta hydrolase [Lysobacter lactosilyticus]